MERSRQEDPLCVSLSRRDRTTAARRGRCVPLAVVLAFLTAQVGCSSHAVRLHDVRNAYFAGHLDQATVLLDQSEKVPKRERDCFLLDQAMVSLASGEPQQAERIMREVRDHFDYLEQKDVAESTVSMLTDDTRVAYAGEDYEKVLIRAMLAVSNLMQNGADAIPYCLQVEQKQQEIIERGLPGSDENPKLNYRPVALGPYLQGVLQEESHRDYTDAERAFAKVVSWEPQFRPGVFDLERARTGVHSSRGNGVVYVFTFVGRGPYKEEVAAEVTSDVLLIADRILSAVGDHTLPPTIAPVKVPAIVVPVNVVDSVAVDVDGQPIGLTQTVTNVAELAVQQSEATFKHTIARAVVRRVVKKAAIYSAKDQLEVHGGLASLALDVAGVAWEATENADTRCWGLLPAQIQVLRLELPAGQHHISLAAARNGRPIGTRSATAVEVIDGRNTYVLAAFPGVALVGDISVSQPLGIVARHPANNNASF